MSSSLTFTLTTLELIPLEASLDHQTPMMHLHACWIAESLGIMVQRNCWHQFITITTLSKVCSLLSNGVDAKGRSHRPWTSRHAIVPPHDIWCDGLPRTWAHDDVNLHGHDQAHNIALTSPSMRPTQSHVSLSHGRPYPSCFGG